MPAKGDRFEQAMQYLIEQGIVDRGKELELVANKVIEYIKQRKVNNPFKYKYILILFRSPRAFLRMG